MGKSKADVTVDFDHHAPTAVTNDELVDTYLQQTCPVAWSETHGGFWYLTRYEDAKRIANEWKSFTVEEGIVHPPPPYTKVTMAEDDPPVHTQYRRALNPTLSKEHVENVVRPRIEYWTDVFIDRVIESGACDLLYDIGVAVPGAVTLEWLGFTDDRDEWWRIGAAWHDLWGRPLESEEWARAGETIAWFDTRIAEELALRREKPRDDTLTEVAKIEIDGEVISEEAAVSLVRVLLGAGVDTTTSLIGSAIVHLYYNADDRRRLREEPELWPVATEEFLRRYPPSRTLVRTCVEEAEIGEFTICPGEKVIASLTAANLDAEVFGRPLSFEPDRDLNPNLAFGAGVHKCFGLHLARAEFIVVMRKLLERLPDYEIREEELVRYGRQSNIRGWMKVPATFTAGERRLATDEAADALSLTR